MKQRSRKKAAVITVITQYSTTLFLIVQGIILVPLYISYAGKPLYGAWLATGSIVGYLGLLDMGLGPVISQQTAASAGRGDQDQLGVVITNGLLVTLLPGILVALTGWLLSDHVSAWVGLSQQNEILSRAFTLAALASGIMIFALGIGGIFLGLQLAGIVSIISVVATVSALAVTVTMLIRGGSIVSIAAGMLTRAVVIGLGNAVYLIIWLKSSESPALKWNVSHLRSLYIKSLWVTASRSAVTLARRSDALIVAALVGPGQAAVLAITQKAADVIRLFVERALTACCPGLAHMFSENCDRYRILLRLGQIARVVIWLTITGLGGYVLMNSSFVHLWLAGQNPGQLFGGLPLTIVLAIAAVSLIQNNFLNAVLFAQGKIELTSRLMIIEVVLRIPLTIVLCIYWGLLGVAAAAAVSIAVTSWFIQLPCLGHAMKIRAGSLGKWALTIAVGPLIPVIIFSLIRYFWYPTAMLTFTMFVLSYIFLCVVSALLLEPDFRNLFKPAIKKMWQVYDRGCCSSQCPSTDID